jgi:hypothetical protein
VVITAALLLAACAGDGAEVTAGAGTDRAQTESVGTPPPPAAPQTVDDAMAWIDVEGFSGAQWATVLTGDVAVVGSSVVVAPIGGNWAATGLVRNASAATVGDVTVTATLIDAAGETLAAPSAEVAVDPLRPGEPAPFSVGGDVVAGDVAQVAWSVDAAPTDGTGSRALSMATFWQRGYGDPRPVDHYLYRDEASEHPFVMVGSVTNTGLSPILDPALVVAWVDADGRVLAVAEGVVVVPDSSIDLDAAPPLLDTESLDELGEGSTTTSTVPPSTTSTPIEADPGPSATPSTSTSTTTTTTTTAPSSIDEALTASLHPVVGSGAAADFIVVVAEGTAPSGIDGAFVYLWAMGS